MSVCPAAGEGNAHATGIMRRPIKGMAVSRSPGEIIAVRRPWRQPDGNGKLETNPVSVLYFFSSVDQEQIREVKNFVCQFCRVGDNALLENVLQCDSESNFCIENI